MQSAIIPDDEKQRLEALYEYDILDSTAELAFDQLTALASSICGTPIALLSLVDEQQQWFKSSHGLDISYTPRDIAFCAHTILQEGVFEVKDARKDERFIDNPLVTEGPRIIFYAGAPLITPSGYKIGSLCVADSKPSELTPLQKQQLVIISNQVVTHLNLKKENKARNQLMNDLLQLNKKLHEQTKESQQFVYSVSHDLRSPLVTIDGFVHNLLKELEPTLTDKQKRRFARITDNVKRMGDLLGDLLELSRVLNHEMKIELIDTEKVMREQWSFLSSKSRNTNIELKITSELPKLAANNTLLSQCFANLLSNAVRYRKPEQPLIVEVYAQQTERTISVFVSDNGIGIDEKYFAKIFNTFEQVEKGEGNGVGLSIVKAAMDKHQGKVHVASQKGNGAVFELQFPKKD